MNQDMDINEKERLIPKGVTEKKTWYRYIPIVVIVLLYKSAEEMYTCTSKQYIYYWWKKQIERRNITLDGGNMSTSTKCTGADNVTKDAENEVQAHASKWELYLCVIMYSITLFTLPVYGSLSDYLGRKFIIILPLLGGFIRSSIASLIIYLELDISYFLIAHASNGLLGTGSTHLVATFSFIADITPGGNSRTIGIAFMECLQGTGKFLSSIGTGYFIKIFGYMHPIINSAGLCLLGSIVGVVWLSESREIRKERSISVRTLLKNVTDFYIGRKKGQDRSTFWLCMIVLVMVLLPLMAKDGLLTLLQLGSPFCWSSVKIGWYDAVFTFAKFIIGLVIIKPLLNRFSHGTTGIFALLGSIGFYVITALAKRDIMLFVAVAVGIPILLPLPIIRGMASHKTGRKKQGALFAGLMEAEVMCTLVSTSIFNIIYTKTVGWMRGFVFIIMAGTNVLALVFMIWLSCISRTEKKSTNQENKIRDD